MTSAGGDPRGPILTDLLIAARRAGVKLRAVAGRPGSLFAWGPRTDEADRIIAAIEARADEIAHLLPQHAHLDPGDDVQLAGDLPLPVLKALVISWVHETIGTIHGEERWTRTIIGRDGPKRNTPTDPNDPPPSPPTVRSAPLEFRGGKVVPR